MLTQAEGLWSCITLMMLAGIILLRVYRNIGPPRPTVWPRGENMKCPECKGVGKVPVNDAEPGDIGFREWYVECQSCHGTGELRTETLTDEQLRP